VTGGWWEVRETADKNPYLSVVELAPGIEADEAESTVAAQAILKLLP
jgi:hypothetical protein